LDDVYCIVVVLVTTISVATPDRVGTCRARSLSTLLDRYGHLMPGTEDAVMDRLGAMQSSALGEVIPSAELGTTCAMCGPTWRRPQRSLREKPEPWRFPVETGI
jgi:hypothetical protein